MFARIALVFAMACCAPSVGRAQFHSLGLGALTCRQGIEAAQIPETRPQIAAWAQGYMSGYNRGTIDSRKAFFPLNSLAGSRLIDALVAFCAKHPDASLDFAIQTIRFGLPVLEWKGD